MIAHHWKSLPLLLVLFVTSCAAGPLVYSEMDAEQRAEEQRLQDRIERVSKGIANFGFKLVPKNERAAIAGDVVALLASLQRILNSKNASEWSRELIDLTAAHLTKLDKNIRELAQDAFDLFNGWIDLPGLQQVIPEVVRDRLLAFLRGAIAGLQEHTT